MVALRSQTFQLEREKREALRRAYAYLWEHPLTTLPDGRRVFHRATSWNHHGIQVLHLKGDPFEMAFQHGKLAAEGVRAGILQQLSRTIPRALENGVSKSEAIHRVVLKLVDFMGRDLRRHIPETYFEQAYAVSEASGLSLTEVSNALLAMEAVYVLAKYALRTRGLAAPPVAFAGCSSFAAWGPATRDGEPLVARNLDYPLNGYFDRYPLVAYHEPTDGGQRYVSLGTAGLFTPCMTAFNEAGIYIGSHLIPTDETSFRGTPIYFHAAEVVRRARSFDEAVSLFRSAPTTVGWAFLVASFREKRFATVEMTHRRTEVRESVGERLLQTNHFHRLEAANLFVNRSVDEDSFGRYRAMELRLDSARGRLDAAEAARILGDVYDPVAGRERAIGATVAVHITLSSSVIVPAEHRFFVATGTGPTSFHPFVEFPMPERFDPSRFPAVASATLSPTDFPERCPEKVAALHRYIEAKKAYEYESDVGRALEAMAEAEKLDPKEPAYAFGVAVLALKQREESVALAALDRLRDGKPTAQLRRLERYLRARVLAARGDRSADALFAELLADGGTDGKMRKAVERARSGLRAFGRYPFRAESLQPMLQFADLLTY
jgi:hypothetical protein